MQNKRERGKCLTISSASICSTSIYSSENRIGRAGSNRSKLLCRYTAADQQRDGAQPATPVSHGVEKREQPAVPTTVLRARADETMGDRRRLLSPLLGFAAIAHR